MQLIIEAITFVVVVGGIIGLCIFAENAVSNREVSDDVYPQVIASYETYKLDEKFVITLGKALSDGVLTNYEYETIKKEEKKAKVRQMTHKMFQGEKE